MQGMIVSWVCLILQEVFDTKHELIKFISATCRSSCDSADSKETLLDESCLRFFEKVCRNNFRKKEHAEDFYTKPNRKWDCRTAEERWGAKRELKSIDFIYHSTKFWCRSFGGLSPVSRCEGFRSPSIPIPRICCGKLALRQFSFWELHYNYVNYRSTGCPNFFIWGLLLLLLPLALQPTVGFGLSNNVFPFLTSCHQLPPSSRSQHLKISF